MSVALIKNRLKSVSKPSKQSESASASSTSTYVSIQTTMEPMKLLTQSHNHPFHSHCPQFTLYPIHSFPHSLFPPSTLSPIHTSPFTHNSTGVQRLRQPAPEPGLRHPASDQDREKSRAPLLGCGRHPNEHGDRACWSHQQSKVRRHVR